MFPNKINQSLERERKLKDLRGANQDEIEEGGLVDFDEFLVPVLELLIGRGDTVLGFRGLDVLFAVLDDLRQDLAGHVRQRDSIVGAIVFNHVLYRLRFQRHHFLHLERLSVRALQRYLPRRHRFLVFLLFLPFPVIQTLEIG